MKRVGACVRVREDSEVQGVIGSNDGEEGAAIDLVHGISPVASGQEGQVSHHEQFKFCFKDWIVCLAPL